MTMPARSTKDSGRLTLIELLLFTSYILLAVSCVRWGLYRYGWRGAVGGLIVVLVILPLVAYALGFLASWIYTGLPPYPACRTGRCNNYQLRRLDNGGYALFCECGMPYRKRGRRFLEVQPDGSVRPYMIWKAFRGWFPERE